MNGKLQYFMLELVKERQSYEECSLLVATGPLMALTFSVVRKYLNLEEMNKIVRVIIIFLLFRIDWRKLLPIGAIITVTFSLLQTYKLPYQLVVWNFSLPGTTSSNYKPFDAMSLNEITPFSHDKQPEIVQASLGIPLLNTSDQVVQSVEVVQDTVKVTQRRRRTRMDIMKPNVSVAPPPPVLSSSAERRRGRYLRDIRRLTPKEALIYAKKEIESVSTSTDDCDPDLYAPLFRNVSVFERSYELMELILKVYIYRDGKRPIFHTPHLRGIYSSEGWFMKFMEASTQFVTRDPEKAHLFYLPYSAKQLQKALYVANSHNMKPLSIFLRDYVNMLASKYPFWNRTHGSDHFLVACHDWGPYTLTEHEELTQNTIKALCNADTSEGIFKAEKDISLPETIIKNPRRPLRNMGGKRVSQRPILAFFAGRMHGRVRPMLVKYWAGKDEDMVISGPMSYKRSQAMSYPVHMKSSKYCICPMGFEVNSPRIVEAIYHECVPVIIADNFVPPLSDVFDWSAFSVIVAEKDIPKLKEILLAMPLRRYLTMQKNVKMLQKHFYWNPRPIKYDMFHMILHSIWLSRLNQIQVPLSS